MARSTLDASNTAIMVRLTWQGGEDSRREVITAVGGTAGWIVERLTQSRAGDIVHFGPIAIPNAESRLLEEQLADPRLARESALGAPRAVAKDGGNFLLEITREGRTLTTNIEGAPGPGASGGVIRWLMTAASP